MRPSIVLVTLMFLVSACGVASRPSARPAPLRPGYSDISVADLKAHLDAGEEFTLLDVRSPEEYVRDGHVAGSVLIPLPELAQRMGELDPTRPVVCICRSGNRSRTACQQLAQAGFPSVANVAGGMRAWVAAGYPVVRP